MKKWEYRTCSEGEQQALGIEGWEPIYQVKGSCGHYY